MATRPSPSIDAPTIVERVRVRHLRGAGYTLPSFGVSFAESAVVEVDRAIGDALVAADPLAFTIETGVAGKGD